MSKLVVLRERPGRIFLKVGTQTVGLTKEEARSLGEQLVELSSVKDQHTLRRERKRQLLRRARKPERADSSVPLPSQINHEPPAEPVNTAPPPAPVPEDLAYRLSPKTRQYLRETFRSIDMRELEQVIAEPHSTWKDSTSGAQVAVRRDAEHGAVFFRDSDEKQPYVISIQPTENLYRTRPNPGNGKVRPHSGGAGRKSIDSFKSLKGAIKGTGLVMMEGGKHPKLTHPDHPGKIVTVPLTPSDHRSWKNLTTEVRNKLGVDLGRCE